jgi:hypothetical protein
MLVYFVSSGSKKIQFVKGKSKIIYNDMFIEV